MPVTRSAYHYYQLERDCGRGNILMNFSNAEGMDLNPLFTGATLFKPAGAGGELKLFEQVGIKLVHGWLVDPGSPEYPILRETQDYDTSVNLLVEADHLTDGQLVLGEDFGSAAQGSSSGSNGPQTRTMSATDAKKVKDGQSIFTLAYTCSMSQF